MKQKFPLIIVAAMLTILASLPQCAFAQTFDKIHARAIELAGNGGTDIAHTITISLPVLSGSSSLTLPGGNAAGILTNDGSGSLSWVALGASSIAPGANNTFLITNGSGTVAWAGLSIDTTLTGNGISSSLGINLANSDVWTGSETFAPTSDVTGLVIKGTSAASPVSDIMDVQNSDASSTYLKVDNSGLTTVGNGLRINGNFDAKGKWAVEEDSVTIVGGSVNNDVSSGSRSRLSLGLTGTPAPATITGFSGGSNGSLLNIMNLTGQVVVFANESAGSAVGNRIRTRTGANIALPTQQTVTFTWDQDFSEWILQGVGGVTTVTTGGTGLTTVTQNGILYGNGTSPIGVTAAAANSVLVTDGSDIPSLSQTLPAAVQANITSLTGMTGAISYPTGLTFDGTAGRTMSLARNTGTNPGQGLTVQAGAPASSASSNNLAGGNLTLSSGVSEGTGLSSIVFQTPAAGSSGNTDNTPATRLMLNSTQLNLSTGVELDQNGTQRISSAGAATFTSLTLGSPLNLANGGTNASLTASNGGIFYSTGSAGAILSGTSTANQVLLSGSSAAPEWSTAVYPASTTGNQLLYSSSDNIISGLTTADNGVLVTDGSGVPSISSTLPNAVEDNITRIGTITSWASTTVPIANGGTGAGTAASALKALVPDTTGQSGHYLFVQPGGGFVWSASGSGDGSVTSIDVSGGTTGLTTSGGPVTTTGVITLAGTLAASNGGTGETSLPAAFNALVPDSTGQSNKFLQVVPGGGFGWTSVGTGNGTVTSVDGSGGSTGLTLTGGPITATGTLTIGGTLAVSNGGTGQTTALTQGGVIYGLSTTAMASSAAGTLGDVLISGGSGAPSFTSSVSGLTITNSSIGSSSPSTGAFTSVTTPTVYGGSASGSTLNLQSTSSGSPSGDYITFTTGGSERVRITSSGMLGIGITPNSSLDVNGKISIEDDTTTIVGGTTNNNVSSGNTSRLSLGLSGTAAAATITGFTGGTTGSLLTLINLTGQNITLANNNAGSTLGNRIYTQTGGDVTIPANQSVSFSYDQDFGTWILEGVGGLNPVGVGGTGVTSFTQNGILYGNGSSPISVTSAAANSVLVTDGSDVPSLSQTLPSAVQANITSLTGMTGAITYPTGLTFDGTAGRTMTLQRNTGTNPGQGLTIQAGAPASSAATQNLAGGNLTLSSGISEGTNTSNIIFETAPAGSIGNSDNAPATSLTLNSTQLNLGSGVELDQNGTQRISSSGAATLSSLTLGSALTVANGGTGQASFTNGQLLIGNTTGNTLAKSTLTAGTGITITNGNGSITIANSSPATGAWNLSGNTSIPGGSYLGTTDANDLVFKTVGSTAMTIGGASNAGDVGIGTAPTTNTLAVGGNIEMTNSSNDKITTNNTDLVLEQTGDTYGTTRLHIQNRNGSNSALFEQAGSVNLCDFGFKPGSGVQSNLRLEGRPGTIRNTANNAVGEFEFFMGTTTTPVYNFSTGEGATSIELGNFGIGLVNPTQKLQVQNGNLLLSNSGTADQIQFQGTSSGISTFQAGAQGSTTINYTLPTGVPAANQALAATVVSAPAVTLGWITPLVNPMTTSGDIMYENSTPAATRLAGNATATKNFLSMTSSVPSWGALAAGDIPTGSGNYIQNQSGSAQTSTSYWIDGSGQVGTSFTAGGLITGSLGMTVTGAAVSLNASSNFATSINTGTSTAAVNIANGGTGGNTIAIGNANGATSITENVGSGNFVLNGVAASTYTIGAATTTGTITIGGTAETGTMTLGSSTGTNIVNLGTGTGATTVNIATGITNAKTIHIADGAVANAVTIGSTTGAASLSERVGTGNFTLNGAASSTYTIGAATTTGTITIGGTAETGTMTLGSSSGTNTLNIANGAGATTLNLANAQVGGAVNIGAGMTTGTITIGGTGLQTGTIGIGTGTGAQTLNFATGGTGVKTVHIADGAVANVVAIGSTTGAATTTLNAGTGGIVLNGPISASASQGSAGQVLLSGGTGAPTWGSFTTTPTDVFASSSQTTTSSTDAIIPSMTLTPGAGDYMVWFSGSFSSSSHVGGTGTVVSIYANGSQIANSVIKGEMGGNNGVFFNISTFAVVTSLGTGQTITVDWNSEDGSATETVNQRHLLLMKLK